VTPKDSLFFYKATEGKKCLSKDACNPGKKFKATPGWINLVIPGQTKCNKERDEKDDENSKELPDDKEDPNKGLPENPDKIKPVIPTPTGPEKEDAKKKCTDKLKDSTTYKKCKEVLGTRFSIKDAVAQCVADALITGDYKVAVTSAFDTMKTECLDEADEEEKKKITDKTCPNDCNGNGKCNTNNGKCECNKGFTAFDCSGMYVCMSKHDTTRHSIR
jgi:hypothetical protein